MLELFFLFGAAGLSLGLVGGSCLIEWYTDRKNRALNAQERW